MMGRALYNWVDVYLQTVSQWCDNDKCYLQSLDRLSVGCCTPSPLNIYMSPLIVWIVSRIQSRDTVCLRALQMLLGLIRLWQQAVDHHTNAFSASFDFFPQ